MAAPTLNERIVDAVRSANQPRVVFFPSRQGHEAVPAALAELLVSSAEMCSFIVFASGARAASSAFHHLLGALFIHANFDVDRIIRLRQYYVEFTNANGYTVSVRVLTHRSSVRGLLPTHVAVLDAAFLKPDLFHEKIVPYTVFGSKLILFDYPRDGLNYLCVFQGMKREDGGHVFECLEFSE